MRHALILAQRNLGQTWPNPAVGALVVKDGNVLGAGWTSREGRPHAEPQALAQAGTDARGATLYVTLEPCTAHGKTPPCVDAIIEAGIRRVITACTDPHKDVNGKGVAKLRAAGIEVTEGICKEEASQLNAGFFSVVTRNRPYVALKIATSLDGRIATGEGESRWITGPAARAHGHLLRCEYDAIITGIGTVLSDDPALTCRLPGLQDRSPVRVVMDRKNRLPASAKVAPAWTYALPLPETLADLAKRGITRLLVEAGAKLSTAFVQAGLVDRLYWFHAPVLLGDKGKPAIGGLAGKTLADHPRYTLKETMQFGDDTLKVMECSPAS